MATDKSLFDNAVKTKGGGDKIFAPRPSYTKEEIDRMMEGYIEITKTYWPFIKTGSHIRYIEIDEKGKDYFNSGGYISYSKDRKEDFHLKSLYSEGPKTKHWSISFTKVRKVFEKVDSVFFQIISYVDSQISKRLGSEQQL